jgi:hypothetical protein
MAQPYDPKKAETFNKLRQQGLSEDAAFAQSGISETETGNYALGSNGQLGATIAGAGKIPGVDYDKVTAADVTESNRFNRGLESPSNFEQVDYAEDAKSPPSKVTPINYTNTSTETVSGGVSTSVVSGPRIPTATSQSLQPAIDAKQAEIDQFQKNNPSDFARKKQGLPPLSPEESEQRQATINKLSAERGELKNQQFDAESTTPPTVTTVPNTATTTQTVTTGTSSTNQAVDPETDQKLSQENETQLDTTASPANASTARAAEPVSPEDDPFEAERLAAEQALNDEPVESLSPEDVNPEDDPFEAERLEREQELNRQELAVEANEPEPVSPEDDPFEAERLEREQQLNDEPVEFEPADVDPEDDPFEAERLEREQELNRQELAETATEAEPVDASQDPGLSDQEILARQNPGGLSDQEILARQQAAEQKSAINQATRSSVYKKEGSADWRLRLQLAPSSNYLYNASPPGILGPLAPTNGVIFPYTPQLNTSYRANYEQYDLVHSNYRGVYYKNSRVDDLSIRGVFTAQDTREADYLLAVIHFFRSVTKMFYGKDEQRGSPPPLVYLSGYGMNQFYGHPCVVTSFQYNLPDNVDYIRATSVNNYGTDLLSRRTPGKAAGAAGLGATGNRILNAGLERFFPAAKPAPDPVVASVNNTQLANYVPTKMEIDITLIPVQTRSQVSKQFSLKGFANGDLIKGGFW